MILSSVCLSVCLFVAKCIMAPRVESVTESCTIVFLEGHFLFTSADTSAVGCIVQLQHTAKNRIVSGIAMSSLVTLYGYSRRGIFDSSVVQLYRTLYVVRSTFLELAKLLVLVNDARE